MTPGFILWKFPPSFHRYHAAGTQHADRHPLRCCSPGRRLTCLKPLKLADLHCHAQNVHVNFSQLTPQKKCQVFFVKRSNFVGSDGRKPVQTADASGIIDAEIKKPQLRLEHRAAQSFPPASSAIPKVGLAAKDERLEMGSFGKFHDPYPPTWALWCFFQCNVMLSKISKTKPWELEGSNASK